MIHISQPKALVRAVTIIAVVAMVVTGVTFASLQSQAGVLKGNSIQTAIASLLISSDGTNFSTSLPGYGFSNLITGGQPQPNPGYSVYVKNIGTSTLALKLGVSGSLTNPDNVDYTKVHVILTPMGGGVGQNFLLSDLIASNASGGMSIPTSSRLIPSAVNSFFIQVSLDPDAVSGSNATLTNIDFNFGGAAV